MKLKDLKNKYWHKLTDEEIQFLIKKNPKWKWFKKYIKQPDWCDYPDALKGLMGCWSLVFTKDRNKKKCSDCDCFIK